MGLHLCFKPKKTSLATLMHYFIYTTKAKVWRRPRTFSVTDLGCVEAQEVSIYGHDKFSVLSQAEVPGETCIVLCNQWTKIVTRNSCALIAFILVDTERKY